MIVMAFLFLIYNKFYIQQKNVHAYRLACKCAGKQFKAYYNVDILLINDKIAVNPISYSIPFIEKILS
ncbi:hypothetical protein DZB91_05195 [Brevibacillus sp. VP]|nr:hypothetical protein DZB91_05195 [Brevibacillus sp. VP]